MRFLLILFSIILFCQAITEFQNGSSIFTVFILFLVSILMGLYFFMTFISDAKNNISNIVFYRAINKTFKAVSLESIIKGNSQTYIVTTAVINGNVIPPRILRKGFSISLSPSMQNKILFQVLLELKGEVYSAEVSNIQISKNKNIFNAQFNDQMKSSLSTRDKEINGKDLLLNFKRKYRKGKLYFECIIFNEHNGKDRFRAEGYLEGSKFITV